MRIFGYFTIAFAGLLWLFGGNSLLNQHLRRLGREPLLFDFSQRFSAEFNPEEKRKRRWLFLFVLILCLVGSTLANGNFD